MASVPVAELSPAQKDELVCTYSSLVLHDSEAEITAESMNAVIKAAGLSVEAYWTTLFSKMVAGKDLSEMLKLGGGGGGGGGAAAAGGDAAAGGAAEAKKEEVVEEEEEEMEFDLFD